MLKLILLADSSYGIALLSASCECGSLLRLLIVLNSMSEAFEWFEAAGHGTRCSQSQ